MMLHIFIHSKSKRAETIALLDSGAMENFINIRHAYKKNLPIQQLTQERRLFNVDRTLNQAGSLKYYVDINTCTGSQITRLWYFLTKLGENQVILGYPWFASTQPRIDWVQGWIDYDQLPIILWSDDADQAVFTTRMGNKASIRSGIVDERIPKPYQTFVDVFSNEEFKKMPLKWPWDHKIELKPRAPPTLISKTIKLLAMEQEELQKFIDKHLERGTIQRSKSPYAASFFFIKKKNGKLRPV
jgi:hypothetical protein